MAITNIDYVGFPDAYCSLQKRESNNGTNMLPIGYLVVDGTDAAAIKRKASADSWANGYRNDKKLDSITFKNDPVVGFKLTGETRTASQGGGETAFRISDPRGFELEIRASNLVLIMLNSTIENGEILEECCWTRKKQSMWLLPTNSQEYKSSIVVEKLKNSKVSVKDIKLGYKVQLQNGVEGIYLGYHALWINDNSFYRGGCTHGNFELKFNKNKRHYFLCSDFSTRSYKGYKGNIIKSTISPKWASILDDSTSLTPEECVKIINQHRADLNVFGDGRLGDYDYSTEFAFISDKNFQPVFKFVEISSDDWVKIYDKSMALIHLFMESDEGFFTVYNENYWGLDKISDSKLFINGKNYNLDYYNKNKFIPTNPKYFKLVVNVDGIEITL